MWHFLCLIAVIIHSGSTAKLNNDKEFARKDPVPSQGILYPFESESRDVRSLDGMWRFLKVEYNDSMRGIEEKWFETELNKVGKALPKSCWTSGSKSCFADIYDIFNITY